MKLLVNVLIVLAGFSYSLVQAVSVDFSFSYS